MESFSIQSFDFELQIRRTLKEVICYIPFGIFFQSLFIQ
jgi:hypothetical protein